MTYSIYPNPLSAEQRYTLGEIIEKGSVIKVNNQSFLMVEVSPMVIDFLKAIRLDNFQNRVFTETKPPASLASFNEVASAEEDRGISVPELIEKYKYVRGHASRGRGNDAPGLLRGYGSRFDDLCPDP
jgi:hypothetical protein